MSVFVPETMHISVADQTSALYTTALPDYRILSISGADAESFLQGQITQDVNAASPSTARLSAYCTAKGRMLASFIFWHVAPLESGQPVSYQLMIRSDIADAFIKRMRMFVLRAKVKIEDTGLAAFGYWLGSESAKQASNASDGSPALDTPEPWQVIKNGNQLQIGLPATNGVLRGLIIADPSFSLDQAGRGIPEQWAVLDILAGIPWVEAANQEMFIPQDINLDAIGAVSFTKGCYPGQEVVARSHYRGKLKRRMLNGFCNAPGSKVTPGSDIMDRENTKEPSGQIVNVAELGDRLYLLFEVRLEAAEHNQLSLGDQQGPDITLLPIPYALDKPALA